MSSRHFIKFLVEKFESLNVSMRTLILQEIEISSNIYIFNYFFIKNMKLVNYCLKRVGQLFSLAD